MRLISLIFIVVLASVVYLSTAIATQSDGNTPDKELTFAEKWTYTKHIATARVVAFVRLDSMAIGLYKESMLLNPAKKQHIESLLNRTEYNLKNRSFIPYINNLTFSSPLLLTSFLILISLFSFSTLILVLLFVIFHREWQIRRQKKIQKIREENLMLLLEYMSNPAREREIEATLEVRSRNKLKRTMLVNEIIEMSKNLQDSALERIKNVYLNLRLDRESSRKIASLNWNIKVKGFKEMAFMNLRDKKDQIVNCLHSRNSILRSEAQLALIRINDNQSFDFLDHLERPFTEWEQINAHELIMVHNLTAPDFSRWLNSSNSSIVVFCIKMIRLLNQRQNLPLIVEKLNDPLDEIRLQAILTIGKLGYIDAVPELKDVYYKETTNNKVEIIRALSGFKLPELISFFKSIIQLEEDVTLEIEAAKAIMNLGERGENEIKRMLDSDDYYSYLIILKHVLDRRL